jgi:hypothetical protein
MCTLSWWQTATSYGVLFNRDESIRRLEAEPPAVHQKATCSYLSPTDPDGGGTWIWVNRHGLIGCILNNYSVAEPIQKAPVSRGLLLVSLAGHDSLASVQDALSEDTCDFSNYRGFHLFFYDGRQALMLSWDGTKLQNRSGHGLQPPITTSGFRPEEVIGYRRERYRRQVIEKPDNHLDHLIRFHSSHDPERPAHSVLMARTDARTVSQSRIEVEGRRILFTYTPVGPDQRLGRPHITRLDRA